jgi:hypothetical protein
MQTNRTISGAHDHVGSAEPTGSEGWFYAALALGLLLYGPVITATTATSYRSQHTSCPGNVLAQEADLVGVSVGYVQKKL